MWIEQSNGAIVYIAEMMRTEKLTIYLNKVAGKPPLVGGGSESLDCIQSAIMGMVSGRSVINYRPILLRNLSAKRIGHSSDNFRVM